MAYQSDTVKIMSELSLLGWGALLLGWHRGWINREDVSHYAVEWLSARPHGNDGMVALLAAGELLADDELTDLMHRLADNEEADHCSPPNQAESDSRAINSWRLARLIELVSRPGCRDERWQDAVEEVYAEFNYPEDMRSCSRYQSGVAGQSTEDAIRHLIRKLRAQLLIDD